MSAFIMFFHAIITLLLIVVILMQSGRGGGLTESFASAESMFGAQTNEFMIKATTVVATVFFLTCIGLAVLSSQRGKSLMANTVASETEQTSVAETVDSIINDAEEIIGDIETSVETTIEPIEEFTIPKEESLPDIMPVDPITESQ